MPYTYEYPRPAVTTDSIILTNKENKLHLLLIQRGIDPFKGMWGFPGGFVNMDEPLEVACARELEEETGLTNIELEQFITAGDIGRDPRHRTISVVYWGIALPGTKVKAGDDAANAQWFPLDDLPPLAFDHEKIIAKFKETVVPTLF